MEQFTTDIKELINRRRRQILVHSCIYYRYNTSIITDKQFDTWARELVALQQTYPTLAAECVHHDAFADFDGSTGFHLPTERVIGKAAYLIELDRRMKDVPKGNSSGS